MAITINAATTAKEFVRIASTAGLSKDVIDLLDKKATLLAEQVASLESKVANLESENTHLKLENAQLRQQLQNSQPASNRLIDDQIKILQLLATTDDFWPAQEVSNRLGIDVVRVHNVLAKLKHEKLVLQTASGFLIADMGRIALL